MIRFAYDAVLKTGIFSKALRVWRSKALNLKTWSNFQTYMVEKYDDYLEDQSAKDEHNFSGAAVQQDTLQELQNVVKAMTRDREDIAILSETNASSEAKTMTVEAQLSSERPRPGPESARYSERSKAGENRTHGGWGCSGVRPAQ